MPFNPQDPISFFSNPANLSPIYSNDPTTSSKALSDFNAAKNWLTTQGQHVLPADQVQQYMAQLDESINEQGNLTKYAGQQGDVTKTSGQLSASNNFILKYGGDGNQASIQWALDTGKISPENASQFKQILSMQNGSALFQDYFSRAGLMSQWQGAMGTAQWEAANLPNSIDSLNKGITTTKSNIVNGLTYGQPDYAKMGHDLAGYWGGPGGNGKAASGVYASSVLPQSKNYYSMAYNIKNDIAEKENQAGLLNSGSAIKNKGMINAKALSKDKELLDDFGKKKASSQANLQSGIDQAKAQYKTNIGTAQGTDLAGLLSGSASNAANTFGAQTNANLQSLVNQNQTDIAQNQYDDQLFGGLLSGVTSTLGTLAGTRVGALI